MGSKSKHHSDQRHVQDDVLVGHRGWLYLAVAIMLIAYSFYIGLYGHWPTP